MRQANRIPIDCLGIETPPEKSSIVGVGKVKIHYVPAQGFSFCSSQRCIKSKTYQLIENRIIVAKIDSIEEPFFLIDVKNGEVIRINGKILFERVYSYFENGKLLLKIKSIGRYYFETIG